MRLSAALSALLLFRSPIITSSSTATSTSASSSTSTSPLPPSCLSADDGSRVDWWFALKHPRGDRYTYLDSSEADGNDDAERARRVGLASVTEGPLARTLGQLYSPPAPAHPAPPLPLPWRVFWNDQPPLSSEDEEEEEEEEEDFFYFAHSKGVLALADGGDGEGGGGFFLSHSAPRFPNDPATDRPYSGLPLPQQRFSQHFLCVSLAAEGMEALTGHLSRALRPRAFSVSLPGKAHSSATAKRAQIGAGRGGGSLAFPPPPSDEKGSSGGIFESAAAFAAGALPLAPTSSAEVETDAGERLLLLATAGAGKGGAAFSPLWDSVVASAVAVAVVASSSSPSSPLPPLAVQSWIRAEGAAPPKCRMSSPLPLSLPPPPLLLLPSVLGVRAVSFGPKEGDKSNSWSSEEAHAKWAVVLGKGLNFSCVGDTNRDGPGRAGGAACARWPRLRHVLAAAVEEVDACEERARD